jgi:hypothetical protein
MDKPDWMAASPWLSDCEMLQHSANGAQDVVRKKETHWMNDL